ncbi:MAG: type II toxin-antitoxin system RelE/ParE family toxin [Alphaproteobacteria bacterium]
MKIEWSLQALSDLDQVQSYLEERSPRASQRMWARIHQRVGLQASMPLAAPLYREGPARLLYVSGTPYLVLYIVEADTLKVEAVLHTSQNR